MDRGASSGCCGPQGSLWVVIHSGRPPLYLDVPMSAELPVFEPGTRVRVTHQISNSHDESWVNTIEGRVLRYRRSKTGSWFAHSKDDRLWLDRLELEQDNGEIVILNLDQFSMIEEADQRQEG